jgi:hypothetical protein
VPSQFLSACVCVCVSVNLHCSQWKRKQWPKSERAPQCLCTYTTIKYMRICTHIYAYVYKRIDWGTHRVTIWCLLVYHGICLGENNVRLYCGRIFFYIQSAREQKEPAREESFYSASPIYGLFAPDSISRECSNYSVKASGVAYGC